MESGWDLIRSAFKKALLAAVLVWLGIEILQLALIIYFYVLIFDYLQVTVTYFLFVVFRNSMRVLALPLILLILTLKGAKSCPNMKWKKPRRK